MQNTSLGRWHLRWFRSLHPRLHQWTEILRQVDGDGARFHDSIMATNLRLNSTALAIVERMKIGQQTLGEIAAELSLLYSVPEEQMIFDVVRVYKRLESCDATVHPWWRYGPLYVQHLERLIELSRTVFINAFARGMGW